MTPTAPVKPTLWDNDPAPRPSDMLIPFATEMAVENGRLVAKYRVYRVKDDGLPIARRQLGRAGSVTLPVMTGATSTSSNCRNRRQ